MTHVPDHATDPDRFIAHAGGSIENKRYTNSLEALDHNYRKGFRLFELDIIETSDHHYVAAHDWGHWQRITGYEGPVPPTREAFKSRELHGRFSPLAMQDINSWFADHPEAVLVTDKVNDPGRFADLFVDRSRLIMELFSIDAVDEGAAAAIRSPMASWNVVMALGEDRVQKLRGMGVVDVAASRRTVEKYPEILKSLKESGIRVFAFHINADPGKDEAHTVCTEMDYFYGLYADVWDFGAVPECTD